MKVYKVDAKEYFNRLPEEVLDHSIEGVKDTMKQLINRFGLQGKSILSIGSGMGYEEYWFYKAHCKLTMLDLGYNNPLRQTEESLIPTLRYIIGDIRKVDLEERWDVIYIGCLSPDIMFKDNLIFSDVIMKLVKNSNENGLFISQSYCGGPKMDNQNNIKLIKEQFKANNLILLNIYHFINKPNVQLIIGFKGLIKNALDFIEQIKEKPDLTKFHGRSKLKTGIKKVYEYE